MKGTQGADMRFLRWVAGFTVLGRRSSEYIRRRGKVKSIRDTLELCTINRLQKSHVENG
jgi:hypothetical protein